MLDSVLALTKVCTSLSQLLSVLQIISLRYIDDTKRQNMIEDVANNSCCFDIYVPLV